MSRKNTLEFQVAIDQSLAASFTSPVTIVKTLDNCSYQINVTTTDSTGTFAIQASDDYGINEITNDVTYSGTWVDLPIGGTPVVSGANDIILVDINQVPFKALRVSYTAGTAGTGTCAIKLVGRQIGG